MRAAIVVACMVPGIVEAQRTAATLSGRVTDTAGAPLAGARVTLTELSREAITRADGRYAFAGLPTGRYTVVARRLGYASRSVVVATATERGAHDFALVPTAFRIEPVTVTAAAGPTEAFRSARSIGVLTQDALRREASISLAHSLVSLPGVRSVSTGLQIGKPVVRGVSGARVLTADDGLRIEDYSWSDEDAPSIDARLAQRVEVVRGPASVLYGSDAVGGVVNVVPEALPVAEAGGSVRHTSAELYGATNNAEVGASLRVEGAVGRVGYRAFGVGRVAQSYHTPAGAVAHTGFGGGNGQLAVGLRGARSNTTLRAVHYGGEFKLLEAVPATAPAGAAGAEEEGPERKLLDDRVQVVHERLVGGVRVEAKGQFQRHSLIEVSDDCIPPPGATACVKPPGVKEATAFDLLLNTAVADLRVHHGGDRDGGVRGTVGVSGMYQTSDSRGPIFLVPDATSATVAGYALEQWTAGRLTVSGGARVDHRALRASPNAQLSLARRDARDWTAATFDAGLVVRATPALSLVASGGTGWRAPTLFDLYANGPQLAEARYEIGDPGLRTEYATNGEAGLRWSSPHVRAEATAFATRIDDFIYVTPTAQTASGLPLVRHVQTDARFAGVESLAEVAVAAPLTLRARQDYVRATNRATGAPLPLIPPARGAVGGTLHTTGAAHPTALSAEVEHVARQTRLDVNDVPTNAYTLVNVDVEGERTLHGRAYRLDVGVHNVGDVAYRDFLSRYKRFALDPGRNVTVRLSTGW